MSFAEPISERFWPELEVVLVNISAAWLIQIALWKSSKFLR
jgi:hypothetical protein